MILLINPKTCKDSKRKEPCIREPNLGLLYLTAILDANEISVDILDLEQYHDISPFELEDLIRSKIPHYQIFGITCLTNTFHIAIKIANIIKEADPHKIMVLGGPHVSFQFKVVLKEYGIKKRIIDYICVGESERSFLRLVQLFFSMQNHEINLKEFEEKLTLIKGIAFVNANEEIRFTGFDEELINLEALPLPARYKLTHESYYYSVANIIVNRGCPNQCSFCVRQQLFKNTVRLRSIESIETEIRDILSMQTYSYINFYDNLNISEKYLINFCNMVIKNQFEIPWGCELRVDKLTREQGVLLKTAGCKLVATGIESASDKVLKMNFKYQDPLQVKKGITILKENTIPVQAYFVFGLPGETINTVCKTIRFIKSLPFQKEDKINYFVATPFPGSKLWDQAKQFGINIFESDFKKYDCEHLIFETKDLKKDQLLKLTKWLKKVERIYSEE